MHVDYVFLLFVSFCGSTKFLFSRLEKVSPTKYKEEKNVCMAYTYLWRLTAVSWNERVIVFSLEVTLERVCWPGKWNCEKRKSVRRWSIYRNYVSWSRLQKRGMKLKCGRSFKQWPRGSPGQWVPETECLRASAIFVSGTSGITSILNYRSVSPIDIIEKFPKWLTDARQLFR